MKPSRARANACPCGTQIPAGVSLCRDCRRRLERTLGWIAAHYAELDTLRARQTRYGSQQRGGGEQPAGIDLRFARGGRASEVDYLARNTLAAWAATVHGGVERLSGPRCTRACLHVSCARIRRSVPAEPTVPGRCAYLARWSDWLRVSPEGPQALDELAYVEQQLRRLVDRPAVRWYVGPCQTCGRALYASASASVVTCGACASDHDVAVRRAWLLEQARDRRVVMPELCGLLVRVAGLRVSASAIRGYVHRGRLTAERVNGQTVYRIGDVLDVLEPDYRVVS